MKKLLSLLLCIIMLLSFAACEADDDEDDEDDRKTIFEDSNTDSNKESTPNNSAEPSIEQALVILGNGQFAIQYGDARIYWQVNAENFELINEKTNQILYTCQERGKIYAMGDFIYVNQGQSGDLQTVRISLADGSSEILDDLNVVGIHPNADALILDDRAYSDKDFYLCTPDSDPQPLSGLDDNYFFCGFGQETAYFYNHTSDEKGVNLVAMNLADQNLTVISTSYAQYDEYGYGSPCRIAYLQETAEAVYYSYGYTGGSGGYYQGGGGFVRVDESGSRKFADMTGFNEWCEGPEFYVFQENGTDMVLFIDKTTKIWNTATDDFTNSDSLVGILQTPFTHSNNERTTESYWIYPDTTGQILQLLPDRAVDYANDLSYVQNICYVGDYTFYDIEYHKINPEPSGWRNYTIPDKVELYMHNRLTGETTLIGTKSL